MFIEISHVKLLVIWKYYETKFLPMISKSVIKFMVHCMVSLFWAYHFKHCLNYVLCQFSFEFNRNQTLCQYFQPKLHSPKTHIVHFIFFWKYPISVYANIPPLDNFILFTAFICVEEEIFLFHFFVSHILVFCNYTLIILDIFNFNWWLQSTPIVSPIVTSAFVCLI